MEKLNLNIEQYTALGMLGVQDLHSARESAKIAA